jgi:hypothetical protein
MRMFAREQDMRSTIATIVRFASFHFPLSSKRNRLKYGFPSPVTLLILLFIRNTYYFTHFSPAACGDRRQTVDMYVFHGARRQNGLTPYLITV